MPAIPAGHNSTRPGIGLHLSAYRSFDSFSVAGTFACSSGIDFCGRCRGCRCVWFFPKSKGFFLTKFQNFFSYAGSETRADVNYLLITPTFLWRITRKNWIVLDAESKTNWESDHRTSYRVGLQLGRMFNRKVGVWVKPEIPFGANREGDWTMKFTLILAK